jgi:HlyD family secretion protein
MDSSNTPLSVDSTEAESKRAPIPTIRIGIGLAGLAIAAYFLWQYFNPKATSNGVTVSGRIEADEIDISAKTGGRLLNVLVQEGETVRRGQRVAELGDEEVNAQLQGAIAQVQSAKQQAQQAQLDINILDSKLQEANLNRQQSTGDTTGRVSQASSTLAAAKDQVALTKAQVKQTEAEIRQAQSQLKLARTTRDRYGKLVTQGAIPKQQFDQAQTTFETAQATLETAQAALNTRKAAVQSAQEQVNAAAGSLTQTQSTQWNPGIRDAQIEALKQQKQQTLAKWKAAQAQVTNVQSTQSQLQKRLASFNVLSPLDGVVQDRPLEPGAVVTSGRTLLTLIDPKSLYLRGYIPEGEIGKVYAGMSAKVYLDSNPKQSLDATLSAIDAKASFTPENVYFRQDRVRQVFGVKLKIKQEKGWAKPGMPADAEILLDSKR